MHQPIDPATRATLETLYAALCSAIVLVARALGRPSPLMDRAERRAARYTGEEAQWRHE
jgi:hypothetical protein